MKRKLIKRLVSLVLAAGIVGACIFGVQASNYTDSTITYFEISCSEFTPLPYARNKSIKLAIERFHETHDVEDLIYVLEVLEKRIFEGGEAPTPVLDVNNVFDGVDLDNVVVGKPVTLNKEMRLRKDTVRTAEGEEFFPLFTDREELDKQPTTNININCPIGTILEDGLNSERVQGVVINPFGKPLMLNKEVLKILFRRVEDNKEGHEDEGNDDA